MSRRGENIYKRKDGRWEARFVKRVMPDGTKKYGSVYGHSYSEVKAKQKNALLFPASVNYEVSVRLENVYSYWITSVRCDSKPNTVMKYEGIYKNHISHLQDVLITDIDKNTVTEFTDFIKSKGLSNKTVNDILIVLNLLLNYAADEYGINIPKIRYLREERKETRYLSVCEQKEFASYLTSQMDVHKFGTLLAMYTGVRVGELCALRWEDIDGQSIRIDKSMMRVNENGKSRVITMPPKSESSVRVIPFPLELSKYYDRFKGSGYVLSTKTLEFTEPRYMQQKFEKYVRDCKLENVTFHTLRHTFATRCIEAGVDAKTVSELLGHADTKITLNRYVHSSFELKQSSIAKMQKLLS
ncbi:MAG: site-specific integrase [Ruminococcaceae bacterium]|nr:site-specific integrase [Oscillospiraceae bacterium]